MKIFLLLNSIYILVTIAYYMGRLDEREKHLPGKQLRTAFNVQFLRGLLEGHARYKTKVGNTARDPLTGRFLGRQNSEFSIRRTK